jgi:hypothetical protein
MRLLNHMSEKEAEELCIPPHERMSYIRVDRGKGNYTPGRLASWRRFVNVQLPNGGEGMPGDEVGVITPYEYPGRGAPSAQRTEGEQKADHIFLQILGRFMLEGRDVTDAPTSIYFAPKLFAKEQEATLAKIGKAALEAAMRRLFSAKRIKRAESHDKSRHAMRTIVLTGEAG